MHAFGPKILGKPVKCMPSRTRSQAQRKPKNCPICSPTPATNETNIGTWTSNAINRWRSNIIKTHAWGNLFCDNDKCLGDGFLNVEVAHAESKLFVSNKKGLIPQTEVEDGEPQDVPFVEGGEPQDDPKEVALMCEEEDLDFGEESENIVAPIEGLSKHDEPNESVEFATSKKKMTNLEKGHGSSFGVRPRSCVICIPRSRLNFVETRGVQKLQFTQFPTQCMQQFKMCIFHGFCACKSSKCCIFQGILCMQQLKMLYFPRILCMWQLKML